MRCPFCQERLGGFEPFFPWTSPCLVCEGSGEVLNPLQRYDIAACHGGELELEPCPEGTFQLARREDDLDGILEDRVTIVCCPDCEGYNFFHALETIVQAGWYDEDADRFTCPRCGLAGAWAMVAGRIEDEAALRSSVETMIAKQRESMFIPRNLGWVIPSDGAIRRLERERSEAPMEIDISDVVDVTIEAEPPKVPIYLSRWFRKDDEPT